MPFRVQHKKGEYLRKKSKPERKKIRKECLANKQSEISDFENEAGNKEELKSKEENHTFSEELLSPVTSFAKICQVSYHPHYTFLNSFILAYFL